MVAARELNVERLPESSRNWINEKLIYTHGYGVTMNPVNGFTPDGLPELVLSDMPVRSTVPDVKVTRPEIYFGQLTNTDVYVNTRQQEFNYPQGESNSLHVVRGEGRHPDRVVRPPDAARGEPRRRRPLEAAVQRRHHARAAGC